MRSPLDALVTQHALRFLSERSNSDILEAALSLDSLEPSPEIKNVCAKVSVHLSDQIDEVCHLLDMQKRAFLEAAFVEAVLRARQIIEAEGVYDVLEGGAS
jgi:hypothetical protein